MNRKLFTVVLAVAVALTYSVGIGTAEDAAEVESLSVKAEGVLVTAEYNADFEKEKDAAKKEELRKTIEGSVSFMVDVPFKKIVANLKPETLKDVSPNIVEFSATKAEENDRMIHYKVEQTLAPFSFALAKKLANTNLNLDLYINKAELANGRLVVDYTLDKEKENDWPKFDGHIYAVDLHNGKTMIMVHTSTTSNYNILRNLRLRLVRHYLAKTKDNIVAWLGEQQ